MQIYDSLGAQQEPIEPVAVAVDYKGDDIYPGEKYYSIENIKVLPEDLYGFCQNDKESNKKAIELLFDYVDEEVIIEYLNMSKEWM